MAMAQPTATATDNNDQTGNHEHREDAVDAAACEMVVSDLSANGQHVGMETTALTTTTATTMIPGKRNTFFCSVRRICYCTVWIYSGVQAVE